MARSKNPNEVWELFSFLAIRLLPRRSPKRRKCRSVYRASKDFSKRANSVAGPEYISTHPARASGSSWRIGEQIIVFGTHLRLCPLGEGSSAKTYDHRGYH
jgi:hypothetical protein